MLNMFFDQRQTSVGSVSNACKTAKEKQMVFLLQQSKSSSLGHVKDKTHLLATVLALGFFHLATVSSLMSFVFHIIVDATQHCD